MRAGFSNAAFLGATVLAFALACASVASVVRAQSAKPAAAATAPLVLDARSRAEVLDALAKRVTDTYVEADTARMIVEEVRKRQRAGAYDAITNPSQFAEVVTTDLRRLNGDLHLSLRYEPGGAAGGGGPVMTRRVVQTPGGGAPPPGGPAVRRVVAGPGGAPPDSGMRAMPGMEDAREKNFGLTRLEILPGNVGYLEISGFLGAPGSEEAVADAMRFLERTDAVVVDVRRNRGGSGMMSHYVFSHFLGSEPVPTILVKSRASAEPDTMHSFAEVAGPRRTAVPLYVLTSRGTGSAAEEFSFVLKNLGRATIVGDRTAGAGHMVQAFDLAHGFMAGVSITRVSDPRTGREWEAIGVQPDVAVDAERALAVAHAAALRRLAAADGDEERRRRLEWTAEWVEARDRGARPDAARASQLAGDYEGDRRVALRDGRLWYRRAGGPASELVPLGGDLFSMDGESRVRFAGGGPSPALTIERTNGTSTRVPRAGSS